MDQCTNLKLRFEICQSWGFNVNFICYFIEEYNIRSSNFINDTFFEELYYLNWVKKFKALTDQITLSVVCIKNIIEWLLSGFTIQIYLPFKLGQFFFLHKPQWPDPPICSSLVEFVFVEHHNSCNEFITCFHESWIYETTKNVPKILCFIF